MSYINSAKSLPPSIWVDFIKSVQNDNIGQACSDFSFIVKSEFGNNFENAAKHIIGAISDIDFDRNSSLQSTIAKTENHISPTVKTVGKAIDYASQLNTMTFAA